MLLISVAMILAFMIVAISYSYQVLLQSAASTAIKELDFAKNNIDNLLSIIENYAVILATDETIQSRLSVSEPDAQTLSINAIALRNQINNIIGTFPRVNAVLLSDRFGNVFDSGVTILHPEEIYPARRRAGRPPLPRPTASPFPALMCSRTRSPSRSRSTTIGRVRSAAI